MSDKEYPKLNPPSTECAPLEIDEASILYSLYFKRGVDPEVLKMQMRRPVGWSEVVDTIGEEK